MRVVMADERISRTSAVGPVYTSVYAEVATSDDIRRTVGVTWAAPLFPHKPLNFEPESLM